jgi:hypothetical protein
MRKTLTCAVLFTVGLGSPLWAEPVTTPSLPAEAKPAAAALPTPLPAELFRGQAREAYKAAAEIPDVFAGLACYCGCKKSYGHRHLLDCFSDEHGASCSHCINEALDAHSLFLTGTPPDEIRKFIDQKYGDK